MTVGTRRRFLFWTASLVTSAAIPKTISRTVNRGMGSFPQRKAKNISCRVSEETEAYEINETGRFILDKCDGQTSIAEIAQYLARDYNVPLSQALREVDEYVALLTEAKLVG